TGAKASRRQVASGRQTRIPAAGGRRWGGLARRRVRLGRGWRDSPAAPRLESRQRLGGREGLVLSHAPGADVFTWRAQRDAAELFHLGDDANARRPGPLAPAGAGHGRAGARPLARRPDALAPCVVHGEAPLRRGLLGDRELARRPG